MRGTAIDRPDEARSTRQRGFRPLGFRRQLSPEEIAERNAAETAKKLKAIFARKDKRPISS